MRRSWLRRAAWMISLLFSVQGWAAKPTTEPAKSTTAPAADENPAIAAGRADAKRDLAAGKLSYGLIRAEVFFLSAMRDDGDYAHLLDYYDALLVDRYGVKSFWVAVLPGGSEEAAHAFGYNQVMAPAIEAKFGKGVLDKTWNDALHAKVAKRAAYLEQRKKATTKPTTRKAADR